ncbi:acetyl-CoA carboxylase beta subunit [Streptacidiphilus sp. MAP12-33]|uniref:carboxyl transferase domain-containing protein n=1 Tax=Streptacidiphilus sp. MAP12-33 TaxID=3156266 RepID=UPI003514F938
MTTGRPATPAPHPEVPSALRFAHRLVDAGSWTGWDTPPRGNPAEGRYADELARARERSGGADESVRTGEGRVGRHRIALLIGEFGFLAGSVGVAAADRLLRAVRRATAERLPLLACPATGGTRMQEGTPAFVGMVPIVAALAAHKAAGLPYLVHLRHPVTGGVLASWGSLGQLTTAEPGALIGFLGPRVYEALYGQEFPPGIQQAEHLATHGTVDAVLDPEALRAWVADTLHILSPSTPQPPTRTAGTTDVIPPAADATAPGTQTAGAPTSTTPTADARDTDATAPNMHPTGGPAGASSTAGAPGAAEAAQGADTGGPAGAAGATSAAGVMAAGTHTAGAPASATPTADARDTDAKTPNMHPTGDPAGASSTAGAPGAAEAAQGADTDGPASAAGATAAAGVTAADAHGAPAGGAGGALGAGGGDRAVGAGDVWESVQVTRVSGRPGVVEVLGTAEKVVRLIGTQAGERDEAMAVALARFGGVGCVVVGHDRAAAARQGRQVGPGGLRAARRGMRLAAELGLPLLTVIDTAGAWLSQEAEEGALAGEIARCLQELTTVPVPTLSVLLGQGTGGAALALLPADRVLAAEHAWLTPLPPEGASVILHRTTARAAELARAQRIGAPDLLRDGTVDRIVPEPDSAAGFVDAIGAAIRGELAALAPVAGVHPARLAQRRGQRGSAFARREQG